MERIKIINQVHFAGEDYAIVWDRALARKQNATAMVDHDANTIFIDSAIRQNKMRTFKALMHETLHVICSFNGVELTEDDLDRIAQGYAVALADSNIVDLEELEFGTEEPTD